MYINQDCFLPLKLYQRSQAHGIQHIQGYYLDVSNAGIHLENNGLFACSSWELVSNLKRI